MVARLGEVLWVVDLNRQSLDRVVPDIAAGRLVGMFEAAGWHTETVKYGRRLRALFERDGGEALRARIDAMGNEEYQRLLRADDEQLRERLPGGEQAIARLIADLDPRQLLATFRDLGGHDLEALLAAYRATDAVRDRPSVIFAYTIKGWSLPTEGHPSNHSALLTDEQFVDLAEQLGTDPREPWRAFDPESPEGRLCAAAAGRLEREPVEAHEPPPVPAELGRQHTGTGSTQQALGRLFVDLDHDAPDVSAHVVTVAPDVASSTNLGGWINRSGIWSIGERIDWFADDTDTLVRWRESDHGRHVELGIAEVNLVGLLGELGATWSRAGQSAAAGRHDLRPVRDARARAVVVRHLRRRAVDPRRDAVGDHARARGRRAPVGRHAVGRDRAARLRGVGAGVHPGLRVVVPARARRAGARRRQLGLLPPVDATDRPGARGRAARGPRARAAPRRRAGRRLPPARRGARDHRRGRRGRPRGARGRRRARRARSCA